MKVHLIKKQSIENYITLNASSFSGFQSWYNIIKYAYWNKPSDIIKYINSADILGKGINRVVFNIGRNKYRMICSYHIGIKWFHLFICWIGTHSEYDELCKKDLQYTVNDY
jgi:mRNA interferase HigB